MKLVIKVCIAISFSIATIACRSKSNEAKNPPSDNPELGVEITASKLWKALKENDYEAFKAQCINIDELESSIKSSNIDDDIKSRILFDLRVYYKRLNNNYLSKPAFEQLRKEIELDFGKDYWTNVVMLDKPDIIDSRDTMKNTVEKELVYPVVYNNDTNYVKFNKFYYQKKGWKYMGEIKIAKQKFDEDEYDFDVNDFANPNQDTSKGIQHFDEDFENEKPNDE